MSGIYVYDEYRAGQIVGSAGNYYTDKDNYYVLGSIGRTLGRQGAEQLGLQGSVDKDVLPVFWRGSCRTERI